MRIVTILILTTLLTIGSASAQVSPACLPLEITGSLINPPNPVPSNQLAVVKSASSNQLAFFFFGDALTQLSSTPVTPGAALQSCSIRRTPAGFHISLSFDSNLYFGSVLIGLYRVYLHIQTDAAKSATSATLALGMGGGSSVTYSYAPAQPSFLKVDW